MRVYPLFSGSSGNSYYISSGGTGILLDIGRSAKQTSELLQAFSIDPRSLQGIFVTHEHTDHIKGLRVFASKYQIPVYSSNGTLQALEHMGELTKVQADVIPRNGMTVGEMQITPFLTSHDCAESVGFRIESQEERTVTLATDLGWISAPVREALHKSDLVILESNHDPRMLQNGPYPYYLKQRILSEIGHLSNQACANILPELVQDGTTRIVLSHLSHKNNTPDLAKQTAICSMQLSGMAENIDYQLFIAPQVNRDGLRILL